MGRFPKSAADIRAAIDALPDNPEAGDAYPGLKSMPVRKLRIALRAYNIGKSGGLRLIFAAHEEKRLVLPLHLYSKKGGYAGERKVVATIKERIKLALAELETAAPPSDGDLLSPLR